MQTTAHVEDYASAPADGLRMLFHRDDGTAMPFQVQLHQVVRSTTSAPWSNDTVIAIPGVDPATYPMGCPTISPDGNRLFFSTTLFSPTDGDVYYSERASASAAWSTPVRIDTVSSPGQHDCPDAISRDGCELYTHRFSHDGTGGATLLVSHR